MSAHDHFLEIQDLIRSKKKDAHEQSIATTEYPLSGLKDARYDPSLFIDVSICKPFGIDFEEVEEDEPCGIFVGEIDSDGNAAKSSLTPGQYLVTVNDVDVKFMTFDDIVAIVQSQPAETPVKLQLVDPQEVLRQNALSAAIDDSGEVEIENKDSVVESASILHNIDRFARWLELHEIDIEELDDELEVIPLVTSIRSLVSTCKEAIVRDPSLAIELSKNADTVHISSPTLKKHSSSPYRFDHGGASLDKDENRSVATPSKDSNIYNKSADSPNKTEGSSSVSAQLATEQETSSEDDHLSPINNHRRRMSTIVTKQVNMSHESAPKGSDLTGKRVLIKKKSENVDGEKGDPEWEEGIIVSYEESDATYEIVFDSGKLEALDLKKEEWQLEE